ncbi:MAG: CoA transferase [Gracilibacteraceae bacterium]|nr:CoA transferase [Gracilibacteraceae bacterium]
MKPLRNIRVLDFSQYIAGPFCTALLGTFGAEVVKIENPKGDDARSWPPIKNGFSGYFANYNGGKKSVCLNFKDAADMETINQLTAKCDVLVHNFTASTRARLQMEYERIAAINPRIIYCNISGWGEDGPYKDRKGFDTVFQAVAGVTGLTGEQGGEPIKAGVPIGDVSGGLFAALSIMMALEKRRQTGEGENIDLSMVEGLYNFLSVSMAFYAFNGKAPERMGSGHVGRVPSQVFKCGDGKYVHISLNDGQWGKFCEIMGMDDWKEHEYYKVGLNRVESRQEVVTRISAVLSQMTLDSLSAKCLAAGVPCGEVNSLEDIERDPQAVFRHSLDYIDYDGVRMRFVNYPARFKDIDIRQDRHIPSIGEHTAAVLAEWLNK